MCWPLPAGRRERGREARKKGRRRRWRGNGRDILISGGATDYHVRLSLPASWLSISDYFLPVVHEWEAKFFKSKLQKQPQGMLTTWGSWVQWDCHVKVCKARYRVTPYSAPTRLTVHRDFPKSLRRNGLRPLLWRTGTSISVELRLEAHTPLTSSVSKWSRCTGHQTLDLADMPAWKTSVSVQVSLSLSQM